MRRSVVVDRRAGYAWCSAGVSWSASRRRNGRRMQFDLRTVDPPGGWGETVLMLFVLLGTVLGMLSCAGRLVGGHVSRWDLATWPTGLAVGAIYGLSGQYSTTFFGFLVIGASMAAGMWLSSTRSGELRIHGLRLLEAAALSTIAGVTVSWACCA